MAHDGDFVLRIQGLINLYTGFLHCHVPGLELQGKSLLLLEERLFAYVCKWLVVQVAKCIYPGP